MSELWVEVGHVGVGLYKWHEGSFQLLLEEGVPVHALEPRVALDLKGAILGAQTILWLLLEETLKKVSQLVRNIGRDVGVAELDLIEQFRPVFGVKRRQSDHHFIDERTQAPPIHWFPMPLLVKDLRREVLRRAADGVSIIVGDIHLGEPEVSQSEIPVLIDQDILWFQTE